MTTAQSSLGTSPAEGTALVGRSEELGAAQAVIDRTRSGAGGMVFIEGEPGIGKSRLLAALAQSAGAIGATVFLGGARELETDLPFSAISDVLGLDPGSATPDAASLGRLVMATSAEPSRFGILHEIGRFVEQRADRGPVVAAADDLQWADQASLAALDRLARRVPFLPLVLLCCARPVPRRPELESLIRTGSTTGALMLELGPLTSPQIAEMVGAMLGAQPGETLLRELEGSAGNPLLAREVVAALEEDGAIEHAGNRAETGRPALSTSLRSTVLRRIGFLGAETMETLRLAAVLGSRFEIPTLAALAGRSSEEIAAALHDSMRSGLLVERGSTLAFRHDLIHEVVYRDLPEWRRRSLHREAARVVAAQGHRAGEIASHVRRSASAGDDEAIGWLRRAAADAVVTAPGTAVDLLRQALELAGPAHVDRDALSLQLARALVRHGAVVEAEDLARSILARVRTDGLGHDARMVLIEALSDGGRLDESVHELEASAWSPTVDDRRRAQLLAQVSLVRNQMCDLAGSERAGTEAETLARRLGDDGALAVALFALTSDAHYRGYRAKAVALATEVTRLSPPPDSSLVDRSMMGVGLGHILLGADRFDDARRVLTSALAEAESTGRLRSMTLAHLGLSWLALLEGRWDAAVAELEVTASLFAEEGLCHGWPSVHLALARIAAHRGDLQEARAQVALADRPLAQADSRAAIEADRQHIEALLLEAQGQPGPAFALRETGRKRLRDLGYLSVLHYIIPDHLRVGVGLGERTFLHELGVELDELARRSETPWARGLALCCRALQEQDPALALQAVAEHRRSPNIILLAHTSELTAGVLTAHGQAAEAVPLLEDAHRTWSRAGAHGTARRLAEKLRRLGVHKGVAGRRARPATGWESVTATEDKVLRLLAEGLTYKEIAEQLYVSRRTVETHVSHLFSKLGVSSRAELGAKYLKRGG